MADSAAGSYDVLAPDYHLIFEDWEASMARQAAALAPIIARECGSEARVLDCACGIGTQALGLARRGFRVTGSDVSTAAIERARAESALRQLDIPLFVADMRDLQAVPGVFDAAIAMDNALPHFDSDGDLLRACREVRTKLRPGGIFLASTRDYDRLLPQRPTVQGPAFYTDAAGRRIVFQLWDWLDDRRYAFHLYITVATANGWRTSHTAGTYRAVLPEELSAILRSAGFADVRWLLPAESGFYQPMVMARSDFSPSGRNAG
jgi:SAM-dependent methyltransferase